MSGNNKTAIALACIALIMVLACQLILPAEALAAEPGLNFEPAGTCTTDPQFKIPESSSGQGIVSMIIQNVQNVLSVLSAGMFNAVAGSGGFQYAMKGLLTLYVAVYGILFTFGMVQITLQDFGVRMIKIGIIATLLNGSAWSFFSNYVVTFFNDGTDQIINVVIAIAVGGSFGSVDAPFAVLDSAISKAVSAKMAVSLLATAFTGPYGLMYALLIFGSLMLFAKTLINAMFVYVMSLVLRALLFGLAPIFLSCLLFNRTRHLFDGWLNQIINACLQPILLFTFFSFFVKLVEASIDNILAIPVCWTAFQEGLQGTPFNTFYWRFALPNSSGEIEPYTGLWNFMGADAPNAPIFPISIVDVLIFLLLVELATRFNDVVIQIAKELAASSTDLSRMAGSVSDWFSQVKTAQTGGNAPSIIGGRGKNTLDSKGIDPIQFSNNNRGGGAGNVSGYSGSGNDYASRWGNQLGNRGGGPQDT